MRSVSDFSSFYSETQKALNLCNLFILGVAVLKALHNLSKP